MSRRPPPQFSIHRCSRAERAGDPIDDGRGIADQMAPGHPDHPVATRLKLGVTSAVALERRPVSVELKAVELDNQALSRPHEVDLVPG